MSPVAVATTRSKVRNRVYVAPQRNTVLNTLAEKKRATASECGTKSPYMILLSDQGLVRRVGIEHTNKPGRPAVVWALTGKGRDRVRRARQAAHKNGRR